MAVNLIGEDLMSAIVAVQSLRHNSIIALVRSDGTVDFRDRAMQPVQLDPSSDTMSSLMQLGFAFPVSTPGWFSIRSGRAFVNTYKERTLPYLQMLV